MTQPRTSLRPIGIPGTYPSIDPDSPDFDAVLDVDGSVWVNFYAEVWERLLSATMTARFIPMEACS